MNADSFFSKQFDIQSHLVDSRFNVQLQLLLGCLQTVADEHADVLHTGWNELHPHNLFWVIYRFGLRFERMPHKQDRITITTWTNPPTSVIQPRNFEVSDDEGKMILTAHSLWTILDGEKFATHSLTEIANGKDYTHYVEDRKIDINLKIPKIAIPETCTTAVRDVLYSDIDCNQHVNNTVYLRWLIDSYPIDFLQNNELKEIIINYTQQARLGDQYTVYTEQKAEHEYLSLIYNPLTKSEICKIKACWQPI